MSKKKKNKKIFGVIAVIVVLGIIVFTYYYLNSDLNTKEDVLKQYVSYINEGKYEEMYELLSDKCKEKFSEDTFLSRNKNIYEGIEAKNVKVRMISSGEDNKLSYKMEMDTIAGSVSFENEMSFEKQDDKKYYINWDSTLIFPELTSEDKVRVESSEGERGRILDRNGIALAEQGIIKSIGFVPGKMEDKESAINKASQILKVSKEFIEGELGASYVQDDTFVPIKTLSKSDEKEIEDELIEIPGIMISDVEDRVYPYGEVTSHLLGYIRGITEEELEEYSDKGYTTNSLIGKTGMEKIFEDTLRGENGSIIYIVDSNENTKSVIAQTEQKTGKDVKLTIDIELQKKIYEQLNGDKGLSIAMNPKTGEILAMVSTPTYDSNDFIIGFTNEEWDALNNNEDNPMYCRYQGSWVPGSSFKPITGAIGLTTDSMEADDDYGSSGLKWQNSDGWGDFWITTLTEYSGPANLKNALIYSDNIYFAKTALKIGDTTFADSLSKIGFGKEIPFEQSMTASQFSSDNTFRSEAQLANTGYGQGELLVNPLHVASIYSAFVNEGNMIKPYIKYKDSPEAEYWIKNAFSKEASETIKNDLIQVVEDSNGTGHGAYIEGMTIAGKTGTAEIKSSQDDENGTELGWFNAFRITDKPEEQLLIINMIEDVEDRDGSHYLLPKVRNMFLD